MQGKLNFEAFRTPLINAKSMLKSGIVTEH